MSVETRPTLTTYAWPQLALARFVAVRTMRTATLWGLAVGLSVFATATGFNGLAATPAQRKVVLDALASNVGLKALLGDTGNLDTAAGFVDWRVIGVMSMVTAVWALLVATRTLRGEEAAGRWELSLTGPTNAARATGAAIVGLGSSVLAMCVTVTAITAVLGARHDAGFDLAHSTLFGLAVISGPVQFLAVGAVTSQVMATRARAAGLAAAVFGVVFMLRALGDAAPSAHWLAYLSPLGWVEQLHPLGDPQPLWLIPISSLTLVLCALAVVLASRRDLGASMIADSDSVSPRTRLLNTPVLLAFRLARAGIISWLGATMLAAALYGSFARSAGKAFASSDMLKRFAGKLAGQAQQVGARTFAGVIFLMIMTLLMAYVASAMSHVRETEAEGYLDNLLVRRVGRLQWIGGQTAIITIVVLLAGALSGLAFWAGAASQDAGLGVYDLILAGFNATAPAMLVLGATIFVFGVLPRATAVLGYALLAWAFLLEMLGSAINFNHWLMDTSVLHHIALAPAATPHWRIVGTYLAIGLVLAMAGAWRFTRRDLQGG